MHTYDFMVIAAHADDAELSMGGTIAKLVSRGKKGIIIDLTQATAATRGTPEGRLQEAQAAAQILGVERKNLGLIDASLLPYDHEIVRKIIQEIRQYQPKVLFTHPEDDGHPDHMATHHLVKAAWYNAGLKMLHPEFPAFRPERLFYFTGQVMLQPTFCVDVSDFFSIKMQSVLAYKSQFWQGEQTQDLTNPSQISSPEFLQFVETRNRYWGTSIKTKYAEAFLCRENAEVIDPTELGGRPF